MQNSPPPQKKQTKVGNSVATDHSYPLYQSAPKSAGSLIILEVGIFSWQLVSWKNVSYATSLLLVKVMLLRTWRQRSPLTKNVDREDLAQLGTQSAKVMLLRTWRQRSPLTKSVDTEDLAQLGTQSAKVMFLRTWRQRSSLYIFLYIEVVVQQAEH